ncbi:MAG: hypothetical protein E6K96_07725, partial [Thaumarchaeota archaeon]
MPLRGASANNENAAFKHNQSKSCQNSRARSLKRHNLLITSDLVGDFEVRRLRRFANVYGSSELEEKTLADRLRETDALLISFWPEFLTDETLRRMKRLRFIQGILVGVDHIPFGALPRKVVVCSNAGAYSLEVGEHAFGLLLSAA